MTNLRNKAVEVCAWVSRVQDQMSVSPGHMRGYIKRRWPELDDQLREQILALTVERLKA